MPEPHQSTHHVSGGVRVILRIEGLALFVLGTGLYFATGAPWWLFIILLLAPDLSFLGYLAGPRIGAAAYNAAHSLIGPIALGAVGFYVATMPLLLSVAFAWLAHVGIDRALGFGLKYASGFSDTHLGRIGRSASAAQ